MQCMKKVFLMFTIPFVLAFAACGGDDDKKDGTNYGAGTEGLAYELISDGTAYRVRKGTVTEGAVTIPAVYRPDESSTYLPVTEVGAADDTSTTGAFAGTSITGATFLAPANVTSIGDYAFNGCTALESVTIPNSVTSIGKGAFINCIAFASVTIPDSVTSIGDGAFLFCTALVSVTIPNSVISIGGSAFGGCTALASVTIPNSVISIGGSAFLGCTALASVTIPGSVTSIGDGAFGGCTALTNIMVDAANPNYAVQGGVLYTKDMTALICAPGSITGNITIPNSVTSIAYAFYGCTSLASVTIPNSVTSIGDGAFFYCTALESVTIPNSVTSIGNSAFNGCTSLASITIPNSVTSIGNNAFSGCTDLASVTVLAAAPPTMMAATTFSNTHASLQIFVLAGSVEAYKAANRWTEYADRIVPIP